MMILGCRFIEQQCKICTLASPSKLILLIQSNMNGLPQYPTYKLSAFTTNIAVPLRKTKRKILFSQEKMPNHRNLKFNFVQNPNSEVSLQSPKSSKKPLKFSIHNYRKTQAKFKPIETTPKNLVKSYIITCSPLQGKQNQRSKSLIESHEDSLNSLRQCLTKKRVVQNLNGMPRGLQRFFTSNSPQKWVLSQNMNKQQLQVQNKGNDKKRNKTTFHTFKYKDIPVEEFLEAESEEDNPDSNGGTGDNKEEDGSQVLCSDRQKRRNRKLSILQSDRNQQIGGKWRQILKKSREQQNNARQRLGSLNEQGWKINSYQQHEELCHLQTLIKWH